MCYLVLKISVVSVVTGEVIFFLQKLLPISYRVNYIILNETVTIGDRDPPWINNKIKSLIKNKKLNILRIVSN